MMNRQDANATTYSTADANALSALFTEHGLPRQRLVLSEEDPGPVELPIHLSPERLLVETALRLDDPLIVLVADDGTALGVLASMHQDVEPVGQDEGLYYFDVPLNHCKSACVIVLPGDQEGSRQYELVLQAATLGRNKAIVMSAQSAALIRGQSGSRITGATV